jgi:hypothetical protein
MRAINHNVEYFPSLFSSEPERWLPSETDLAKQQRLVVAKAAHNAFSPSPRDCVAKNQGDDGGNTCNFDLGDVLPSCGGAFRKNSGGRAQSGREGKD